MFRVIRLVAVDFGLEGTVDVEAEVLSLDGGELGELSVDVVQVLDSDLLVKLLGEDVDANILLAGGAELDVLLGESLVLGLVQGDLGKDLVGERAGHDEGRVTGGTAKVDKTTLSKQDDVLAVEEVTVDLGLDALDGLSVGLQPGNVDLNVEVTNVANNGVVAHGLEVAANQDVTATSGGDEDLTLGSSVLHGGNLVTLDSGLEGVDGVDLSNDNAGTHGVESLGTTLTDITVTGDNGDLTSDHDIGGTLDTIDEGLTATVKVVELGLGDTVVDVDGGNLELAILEHTVEVVNTGGGLLRDTEAALELLGELGVDKGSEVTTVVEDQVELLAILEGTELLLETPLVLLLGLTLPGEAIKQLVQPKAAGMEKSLHRDTGGSDGGSGVVLGGEDVARGPGDLSTEVNEGLNEDGGLDGCIGG